MSGMYCGGHGHALPCPECAKNLANRSPKGAEQPAPQTESGADALQQAARRYLDIYEGVYDHYKGYQTAEAKLAEGALRAALAAAEPTNSKGAEQAAETLTEEAARDLFSEWYAKQAMPELLARVDPQQAAHNAFEFGRALASPPTQEGDGARERVSAAKESK